MIDIRIYGRGGQGAFTASKILGASALLDGKFASSFPSFGPERRGAPVNAYAKIDSFPVLDRSMPKHFDYILVLDDTLYESNFTQLLKENGKVFINTSLPIVDDKVETLNATALANEILERNIANTAMLAYLVERTKLVSNESFQLALKDFLPKGILEKNLELVERIGGGIYEKA